MLILEANPMEDFSDAVFIMHRFDESAYFKCSSTMFSILIPQTPSPHSIVSLTLMPEFFKRFVCDQIHYLKFSIDDFFLTLLEFHQNGHNSLILSLLDHRRYMLLEFRKPSQEHGWSEMLSTLAPRRHENPGVIDFGFFVSIDLEEFRRIVIGLNNVAFAPITITNSQIMFLVEDREIILTTERRQCIIGGVTEGDEIQSAICLRAKEFFYNFTSQRLWLFKSYDPNGMMLVAPMGLYAHISLYFPEDLYIRNRSL